MSRGGKEAIWRRWQRRLHSVDKKQGLRNEKVEEKKREEIVARNLHIPLSQPRRDCVVIPARGREITSGQRNGRTRCWVLNHHETEWHNHETRKEMKTSTVLSVAYSTTKRNSREERKKMGEKKLNKKAAESGARTRMRILIIRRLRQRRPSWKEKWFRLVWNLVVSRARDTLKEHRTFLIRTCGRMFWLRKWKRAWKTGVEIYIDYYFISKTRERRRRNNKMKVETKKRENFERNQGSTTGFCFVLWRICRLKWYHRL